MAHIKDNPTEGHVEGDRIWDKGTNALYILKKGKEGEQPLVWDRQVGERWNPFRPNRDILSVKDSTGSTQPSSWGKEVQKGFTIKDGQLINRAGQVVDNRKKKRLFTVPGDSKTAGILATLRERQDVSRDIDRRDSKFTKYDNQYNDSKTKLEQLAKRYNVPYDTLIEAGKSKIGFTNYLESKGITNFDSYGKEGTEGSLVNGHFNTNYALKHYWNMTINASKRDKYIAKNPTLPSVIAYNERQKPDPTKLPKGYELKNNKVTPQVVEERDDLNVNWGF